MRFLGNKLSTDDTDIIILNACIKNFIYFSTEKNSFFPHIHSGDMISIRKCKL